MNQRHTPKTLPGFPIARGNWPLLGHMPSLLTRGREKLLDDSATFQEPFWLNLGFGNWLLHLEGEEAHTVMKNKKTRSIVSDPRFEVLNHSMLVKNGEEHRKVRGLMNAPFTPKGLNATKVGEIVGEVLCEEMARWTTGTSLPVMDVTSRMALDVIFRILGVPAGRLPEWRKHYDNFFSTGAMIPLDFPGSPARRSKQANQWLDEQFSLLLEEAREKGDQETMLGVLAHSQDEEGKRMPEEDMLANLRLLGFAGHETTAATMGWMMLHAAQDPVIWKTLCDEANATDSYPTTPKDLAQFPYAEALFRECLRLYPTVIVVMREVIEPLEVEDRVIPEGTMVGASVVSLSLDQESYPEPLKLKPERWMGRERSPSPAEAVQFGGGPHFCLGYHMAVLEGSFFMIYAAKHLSKRGLTPHLRGKFPKPVYLPLTHPPKKAKVVFRER